MSGHESNSAASYSHKNKHKALRSEPTAQGTNLDYLEICLSFQLRILRSSLWCSRLRTCVVASAAPGYLCGEGSIPGLGTSTCHACSQKRERENTVDKDV